MGEKFKILWNGHVIIIYYNSKHTILYQMR